MSLDFVAAIVHGKAVTYAMGCSLTEKSLIDAGDGESTCPICGELVPSRSICHKCLMEQIRQTLGEPVCKRLGIIDLPPGLKLSVVVPVYNEKNTLHEILRRIQAVRVPKEIILVDDYSRDGTRELLQELDRSLQERQGAPGATASESADGKAILAGDPSTNVIRIFFHDRNRGKGAALRTGFSNVTGSIVVVQDADLEYDPAEYPQLIAPIIDGRADVVYGSRFIGETHRVLFYWHYIGNKLLTTLSNMFTGLNLTDMETCYKVFRREAIDSIAPTLKSDRFGFEPEVTAKIARRGLRVYELPVSYSGRDYAEGKKITWKDGFQALWCIIRYRFGD
jgi:glycosyltransferase involved in cell wall biosynthesis